MKYAVSIKQGVLVSVCLWCCELILNTESNYRAERAEKAEKLKSDLLEEKP